MTPGRLSLAAGGLTLAALLAIGLAQLAGRSTNQETADHASARAAAHTGPDARAAGRVAAGAGGAAQRGERIAGRRRGGAAERAWRRCAGGRW